MKASRPTRSSDLAVGADAPGGAFVVFIVGDGVLDVPLAKLCAISRTTAFQHTGLLEGSSVILR